MSLSQEEPPEGISQELKEYLSRRFIDIDNLLSRAPKHPERKQMPYKPQFGDVQYFGDPALHDYDDIILTEGLYCFKEFAIATDPRTGFWNKLVGAFEAINTFTEAGYGGVGETSQVSLSNITATPQIVPATNETIATPRNIIQDTDNDGLVVEKQGIWQVSIFFSMSFVDINSGRTITVELFNADTANVENSAPVFVGRNQAGVNIGVSFLTEVFEAEIGDLFVVRISSAADTFTGVNLETYAFSAVHVSNAQALEAGL